MRSLKLQIGISGITGKMGQAIFRGLSKFPQVELASSFSRSSGRLQELIATSEVILDFSSPQNLSILLNAAKNHDVKLIIGTTGLTKEVELAIEDLSKTHAILYAPNMSLGVNIINNIISQLAGKLFDDDFDAEIIDIHHKEKLDAPSGTALMLASTIAKSYHRDFKDVVETARLGKKRAGSVGISNVRVGGVIGEHHIIFANELEQITVSHKALSRDVFALQAIKAAIMLHQKGPGLYSLTDL